MKQYKKKLIETRLFIPYHNAITWPKSQCDDPSATHPVVLGILLHKSVHHLVWCPLTLSITVVTVLDYHPKFQF